MPFKAKVNGKTIISIEMGDDEWNELKKAVRSNKTSIKLFCCGGLAYPRMSKLGTKHFVHKTKHKCNWKPESVNHLKTKEIIFKACKEEGWNVEPEYNFNDWIADIFATSGNTRIAFEAQWSRQTDEETRIRQEKYRKDAVKGIWFFRYLPDSLIIDEKVPGFKLSKKDDNYFVTIGFNEIELSSAVKKILRGSVEFRKKLTYKRAQIAHIYKFEMECWKCGRTTPVIGVYSNYVACCGGEFDNMDLSDEDLGMAIASLQNRGVKELADLAPIKKRYSKTAGYSYWSNGCKWCGAMVGEWFLRGALLDFLYAEPIPILKAPFTLNERIGFEDCPHWCLKGDEGFCEI